MKAGISIAALAASLAALSGCTHTGNLCRFEQRTVAGLTSVSFGEYTLPVVSISTGPSLSVWQSKGQPNLIEMKGYACTTNETSALGVYSSRETKSMEFEGVFRACTNLTEGV